MKVLQVQTFLLLCYDAFYVDLLKEAQSVPMGCTLLIPLLGCFP